MKIKRWATTINILVFIIFGRYATYFRTIAGEDIHHLRLGDNIWKLMTKQREEYLILDTERQMKTRTGTNLKKIQGTKSLNLQKKKHFFSQKIEI
jgi:hypothetical protein